jgi:hypothetical protein
MIRKSLAAMLIALVVALLPQAVLAAEGPTPQQFLEALRGPHAQRGGGASTRGPQAPRFEVLLERLDANDDGKVALDEIPERAPGHFKAMLKRADRNEDKVITRDELAAAARQFRPPGPAPGSRRPGPPSAASRRPGPSRSPGRGAPRGPMHARFMRGGDGPQPFGPRGARPQPPDPKALFARLDRDKDGKLSLEEFTVGVRMVQAGRRPPFAGPPRPPMWGRGRAAMAHRAMAGRAVTPGRGGEARGRPAPGASPDRAAQAKRAAAARRAAAVRGEAEARRRPAPPTRAAPPTKKPGTREASPEARKRAAEAKAARAKRAAAAKKKAEARKKKAEAARKKAAESRKKGEAPAATGKARKPADETKSKLWWE